MADADVELRERLVRLETRVDHFNEKQDKMAEQVKEVHGALLQAKGGRLVLIGLWVMAGAALGYAVNIGRLFGWPVK